MWGFKNRSLEEIKPLVKDLSNVTAAELTNLRLESDYSTEWTYDKNGNQLSILSTEKPSAILNNPIIKKSNIDREFGYTKDENFGYKTGENALNFQASRIVTAKSTFEYGEIEISGEKKSRIKKRIDWKPRFDEPFKSIDKYTYYDFKGNEIEWQEKK
jgi:hypothetical protein